MAKNKMSGVSEALTEQMKERFTPSGISGAENQEAKENDISVEVDKDKIRKNFYIDKRLVKMLRRMAYEEETDQTKIVNAALEAYFKERGYI